MAKEFNFSRVVRRGRRAHHCCECRRVIPVGTQHVYNFGYCEGNPYQGRFCGACAPRFKYAREVWAKAVPA